MRYLGRKFKHYGESQKPLGVPEELYAEWREYNERERIRDGWELFEESEYNLLRPENDRQLLEWREVYGPKTDEELAVVRVKYARQFGEKLIDEFAAFNVVRGLNTDQVLAVAVGLKDIMALLQSGSLYAALKAMSTLQPNPVLPEEAILNFGNKIRGFIRRDPVSVISDLAVTE